MRRVETRSDEKINIEYDEIVRETDAAICVKIDGKDHWLPKSQIEHDEAGKTVSVPEWLALNQGLV